MKPNSSPVNHPPHYNSGKIEVIEFIEDQGDGPGFCRGNAIKYIARAGKKLPEKCSPELALELEIIDLEKARWYLERLIETAKARREQRDPARPNDMNPRDERRKEESPMREPGGGRFA